MGQTFYIDIEEEISSVISRLADSKSKNNLFVVPKRAIFVQSVVNLKLLKREADKFKKNIIIATQDEQAKAMAERVGIDVQDAVEGIEPQSQDQSATSENAKVKIKNMSEKKTGVTQKKERLKDIGTESFVHEGSDILEVSQQSTMDSQSQVSRVHSGHVHGPRRRMSDISPGNRKPSISMDLKGAPTQAVRSMESEREVAKDLETEPFLRPRMHSEESDMGDMYTQKLDPRKEEVLDRIFENNVSSDTSREADRPILESHKPGKPKKEKKKKKSKIKDVPLNGRHKGIVFAFILLCLVLLGGIAAFLLLPKADVVVHLQKQEKRVDFRIKGLTEISDGAIEVREASVYSIERESEFISTYKATGTSDSSGSKARGKLVIYNEFSSSPQPLVATTRLETEDGKVFRLIEGVTVPGTRTVSGSVEPGAIEVEVIADQVGSDYNVDPTTFTIPGFKGTSKFDKFYAKSTESMKNGGLSSDALKTVSESDIEKAKSSAEERVIEDVKKEISGFVQSGDIILDEAVQYEILDSVSLANKDDVKDSFEYKVSVKIIALAFSEEDVEKIIRNEFNKRSEEELVIEEIIKEYASVEADFENKSMEFAVHSSVLAMKPFEKDRFKADLLGKNEEEIKNLLRNDYSNISNLEIGLWPNFIVSSIPQYESRVSIEVKNN